MSTKLQYHGYQHRFMSFFRSLRSLFDVLHVLILPSTKNKVWKYNVTMMSLQGHHIYIIFSGFVSQIVGISFLHYCFRLFYFHTLVEGTYWDTTIHFLVPNKANARHVCLLLSVNRVYGDCFGRLGNSTGIGRWRREIYTAEICRDVGSRDHLG